MNKDHVHRAYSVIDVKSIDEEARSIKGIASTPSTDRQGDIVEPMGAKFKTPMPLLWQHDTYSPVGIVTYAEKSEDGIPFEATIAEVDGPPALKNRLDEAWASLKAGLVRGVSIGFRSLEREPIKGTDGIRFKRWEWLELSLVTIPANAEATITSIKSFDDLALRAASGHAQRGAVRIHPPGDAGNPEPKGKPVKNINEQISQFEASRAAKVARMTAIMESASTEARTLEDDEAEEHDELAVEVKKIDEHLQRLRIMEKANAAAAKPVTPAPAPGTPPTEETRARSPIITVTPRLEKGTAFTRYAMALACCRGNLVVAEKMSEQWKDTPEVNLSLKAAVAAGTTQDSQWAGPLVAFNNMASEFIELLRPATIIGRVPGLRRVPFNIKVPAQTAGSSVNWVGEAAPKPVSKLAFSSLTLGMAKAAGIVVLTDELVRSSNPSAEALVRADLTASIAQFLDTQFVDPAVAAVANVSPASITHGAPVVPASGTDDANLRKDVSDLIGLFIAAGNYPTTGVWITTPQLAFQLGTLVNAFGQRLYPTIDQNGGSFYGMPVVTSASVPAGLIILANATDILLADDGGVSLDVSTEASLQMDSAPDNPPTATTVLVSLWQNNLVGLRAERHINWLPRRSQSVAYISGANYDGSVSTPPA